MRNAFPMIPRSKGVSCTLGAVVVLSGILAVSLRNGELGVQVILGAGMLVLLAFFASLLYSSPHTRFELSPGGLAIKGILYGRRVPASSIKIDGSRVLDLARDPEYRPRWRTNGLGLPDYLLGWFRLRNKTKTLLFVTDRRHLVHIPTTEGFSIILSVPDPEAFLQALGQVRREG